MSASLVGSEMCIRDSLRPFWHVCLIDIGAARLDRFDSLRSSSGTRCTVSYTHLTLPTICSV
eukprot:319192-Alexandrium_andersonii.AAC.1